MIYDINGADISKEKRVIEVWNFIDANDTKELVVVIMCNIITTKSERTKKYQYNIIYRNGK